jgi:hypothetical protein
MTIPQAVFLLTTQPKEFLKKNFLNVAGGNGRAAGPAIFQLSLFAGTVQHRDHSPRPKYQVSISAGNNGGNPGAGVILAANEFVAYYVPMEQMNAAGIFTQPNPAITPLVLTSQLTGCTFAFDNTGGTLMAGHMQPTPLLSQGNNRYAMKLTAINALGANTKLVQKGDDHAYSNKATIVAVYRHNTWKVYMQRLDYIPGNGAIGYEEIVAITKL